jgi:hypothetical protein
MIGASYGNGELKHFRFWILDFGAIYAAGTESSISRFPQFPLSDVIPQYVEQSKVVGINTIMRAFRNWVREQIASSSH